LNPHIIGLINKKKFDFTRGFFMQYQVELLEVDKMLGNELKLDYEMQANNHLEELKAKDICGANYQANTNVHGYKVIFKNGQLYETIQPVLTDTNSIEIHCEYAFGMSKETKDSKEVLTAKGKRKRKPRNNTYGELTYFKLRDHNGEYIAIGLRAKNKNCRKTGYNKYITYHIAALIDPIDLPFFLEHRMRMNSKGRLVIVLPGRGNVYVPRIIMARILTGKYDDRRLSNYLNVDHKDRNPLNNRAFNIRFITPIENALNTEHIDRKIAKGTFFGLGIDKVGDIYEVKAYKLTGNGGYKVAEKRKFEDLAVGKAWKDELEAKLLMELGIKEINVDKVA
jgi:hypothetical protein